MTTTNEQPSSVTGVQLAQGIGHQPARGFWTEAWAEVLRRPAAVAGLVWIAIIAFFALYAPLLASGHPLMLWTLDASGNKQELTSPLIRMLSLPDVMLIAWGVWAPILFLWPTNRIDKPVKLRLIVAGGVQLAIAAVLVGVVSSYFSGRDVSDRVREIEQWAYFEFTASLIIAIISSIPFLLISIGIYRSVIRVIYVAVIALIIAGLGTWKWSDNTSNFFYRSQESGNEIEAVYTLVPFSPNQSETAMYNRAPMSTPLDSMWDRLVDRERINAGRKASFTEEELAALPITESTFFELRIISRTINELLSYRLPEYIDSLEHGWLAGDMETLLDLKAEITTRPAPVHVLGTDTLGQDVLSQMFHACRLSISIGFVSTGIAVVIGVTIGSLMGYFGGWVDLLLYRVVEIFMAIPVLFLLIVAAGVLPRNIYVMMAIIGCFSWTTAARFIRAEFMKLKETDYVQAANAMGLPLWSILFKHMLPNGVTPVLVESSFLIAAAILIEAILSFLGLGPAGQASWGTLLSNASGETSDFLWWLAIFPGGAIFLTTMAYNLIGEALRDAIDPKLKKARV